MWPDHRCCKHQVHVMISLSFLESSLTWTQKTTRQTHTSSACFSLSLSLPLSLNRSIGLSPSLLSYHFISSLSVWRCGLVVDTWFRDQKVPGSSPGCARWTLSSWKRLFTCISSPHSLPNHSSCCNCLGKAIYLHFLSTPVCKMGTRL